MVEEGGSVLVDSQALQVSDAAAPTLTFLVEHRPKHGELHLAGTQGVADRWTLAQVETGLLSYHHTGGEVGLQSQVRHDYEINKSKEECSVRLNKKFKLVLSLMYNIYNNKL